MQILSYATDDPDAPEALRCAATLVLPQQTAGKRVSTPTWTAHGATPQEARAKLEAFWAEQQPKPRAPRKPKPESAAGPAARLDMDHDLGDVI